MTCEGCEMYLTLSALRALNNAYGDDLFPLDVEWAHCAEGGRKWLNCRRRQRPSEEAEG